MSDDVAHAIASLERIPDPVLILRAYFLGRVQALDSLVVDAYNKVRKMSKQGNQDAKTIEVNSEKQSKEQREANERVKLALYKAVPKSEQLKNTKAGKDYVGVYGEYALSRYLFTVCTQRLQPSSPAPTADPHTNGEEGAGGDSTHEETTTTEEEQCPPNSNHENADPSDDAKNRKQRRAHKKIVALQQE